MNIPDTITEEAARKLINRGREREKLGYPSPKVTAILRMRGLNADIPRREAGAIIDGILANGPNGWRNQTPQWAIDKYGRKV